MDNPNQIFKPNSDSDPLDECPTLQEYILQMLQLLTESNIYLENADIQKAKSNIENCIEMLKEMAVGDWTILNEDK